MILVIVFSVLYANVEGNGIIEGELENGKTWPKEGVTQYTHLLECDYRHDFPGDREWTYTYDLHCMKITDGPDNGKLKLSINYDNNVFDTFDVKSCELNDVIKSVFPPKQKNKYSSEDEADRKGRPTISYLKYKKADGNCFARKYKYENRAARAAERFEPESIACEGEEWSKHGKVAEFTNCRVPTTSLSKIVIDSMPDWTSNTEEEKKHERFLECTFDQFSKLYELTCVQGDETEKYFAFVTYQNRLLDRFTVTSCEEEDIVSGIFPVKETTQYPNRPRIQKIWFRKQNGECYRREYPNYSWKGPLKEEITENCPTYPDEWTNPSWGHAGIWRECTGTKSIKGRAATQSKEGQPGAKAEDQHESGGNTNHQSEGGKSENPQQ